MRAAVFQVDSIERPRRSFAGTEYRLEYWNDSWRPAGGRTAGDGPLIFEQVPSGGLYWLRTRDSRDDERIFTYSNDRQIWW